MLADPPPGAPAVGPNNLPGQRLRRLLGFLGNPRHQVRHSQSAIARSPADGTDRSFSWQRRQSMTGSALRLGAGAGVEARVEVRLYPPR